MRPFTALSPCILLASLSAAVLLRGAPPRLSSSYDALYGVSTLGEDPITGDRNISIALINSTSGAVVYTPSQPAPPADVPCANAFDPILRRYFLIGGGIEGEQWVLSYDAATGKLLSNVTTVPAAQRALPNLVYSPKSGSLLSVTIDPAGGCAVYTIDPVTGNVTLLSIEKWCGSLNVCELEISPPSPAHPLGMLHWAWAAEALGEHLSSYDIATAAKVADVDHPSGGLNALTVWTPPGASHFEVLAMSFLNTRPMDVVSIEPVSGNTTLLFSLPSEEYAPYQGDAALDPYAEGGAVWLLPLTTPDGVVLASISVGARNVTMVTTPLQGDFPIWSVGLVLAE